jgi:hypothetical protein
MDQKLNMEVENIYDLLGVSMPYKIMCKYYSGEFLYKRILVDILNKKWRPKLKIEKEYKLLSDVDILNSNCNNNSNNNSNNSNSNSNGKVYMIKSDNIDKVYIGSTCFEIEDRLNKHMLDYEFYEKNKYHYCSSYEVIRHGVIKIILLEDGINKKDLLSKESEYIYRNLENCVNIIDPLTKKKLYDNEEERYDRLMILKKHIMSIVIKYIIDNNIKIYSMEDMYAIYKKELEDIKEKKLRLDEDYYMTLVEFIRLKNMSIN